MTFSLTHLGPYTLPDFPHIADDDYRQAFLDAMDAEKNALDAIATDQTSPTVELIHDWEKAELPLMRVGNAFWTYKDADTNDRLDKIEAEISPLLSRLDDEILMDRRLYDRLLRLNALADEATVDLDAEDRWWLSEQLRTYRRCGIELDEDSQASLKQINEALSTLETTYSSLVVKGRTSASVHLTSEDEIAGLSEDDKAAARRAAQSRDLDGWVIELVNTTRQPLLASLDNRETRRKVFEASVTRDTSGGDTDTRPVIIAIARLRAEKAELLGYDHYAAYIADDGCAKTTDAVMNLLTRAATAAFANGHREAELLQRQLDGILPGATLEPWDWAWLAEKTRKAQFDLDEAQIMPYLSFETVLEKGVFAAANRLYGLSFHPREDVAGYTQDCRTYEVRDGDGSPLGLLQLDPYARPSKQGGAWMTSLTDQGHLTGDMPVATNNCNQVKPTEGKPTLMTWDEVTTLFHEFGHDLNALLADTRYPSLSGTNTPRDFVEFPSQVNEMWAWEPSVIASFATRWDTGEPMPGDLIDKILASRSFGQGFDAAESYAAMLLDQVWHQTPLENLPSTPDEVESFEKAALEKYGVGFPLIPPRYKSAYFSHIWGNGYSAAYYGYMWAEVLDADTVAWFAENGGLTRENGDRFRRMVLAVGGSTDVMKAYRAFRGADPDPIHLFRRRGLKI